MARKSRDFKNRIAGRTYTYQVAAIRWGGKYGDYSDPASVELKAAPAFIAPDLTAIGFPVMDFILVNWTGVGFVRGRVDLEEYRVYRTTVNNSEICNDLDERIDNGQSAELPNGIVIAETRATFFIDVGYDEDNPTKNANGPRENTTYYYWVRAIGKDGLKGNLSLSDNAVLGPPEDIPDLSFEEDTEAGFLWLKGWKVKWTPVEPAEGYYVRYRRYVGGYRWGLWSRRQYVPHDTETTEQSYTIPLTVVGWWYQVEVQPVNHYWLKKYQGNTINKATQVLDAGAPGKPTKLVVTAGNWHNNITFTAPADNDIARFEIFWQVAGGADPDENTSPKRVLAFTNLGEFTHFFAGENDAINWEYWVRAVDWFGNKGEWEGPAYEQSVAQGPTVVPGDFFWGTYLNWSYTIGDRYYTIYRGTTPGFTPDSSTMMVERWWGTFFIDLGQKPGFRLMPGQDYYYKVKATRFNLQENFSVEQKVTPRIPSINDDTTDNLSWNRVAVTGNQVVDKVNSSSITLRPTSVEIRGGIGGIYSGSSYLGLYPVGGANGDLFLGHPAGFVWRNVSIQGERVFMRLPSSPNGSDDTEYELYYDSGYVKASAT